MEAIWPILGGVLGAVIVGACGILSALVARQGQRLREIHVMVNSNLEDARKERALAIVKLADLSSQHTAEISAAIAATADRVHAQSMVELKLILESLRKENLG